MARVCWGRIGWWVSMILAVDVGYSRAGATAAGVLFRDWASAEIESSAILEIDAVEEYVPGAFYRRELPCIEKVLERIDSSLECIVIDGYVYLGEHHRLGLGAVLWERLERRVPVVGVAKTAFRGTPEETKVYRAGSSRALFVTSAGIALEEAKQNVMRMRGKHRIPDVLRLADRLSRRP